MVDKTDILLFLLEKGKASWSDLEKRFVKGPKEFHIARQTLANYIRGLLNQREIIKIVDKATLKPVYVISERGKKELAKKVEQLTNEVRRLQSILKSEREIRKSMEKDLKEIFRLLEFGEKRERESKLAYIEAILLLGDKLDEILELHPEAMTEKESEELVKKLSALITTGKPSKEFLKELEESARKVKTSHH